MDTVKHDLRYGGTTAGQEELDAIIETAKKGIETGNWQAGEQAALFEKEAAEYLGVKHCVLTTSGSCAGLLALSALELPKDSEVIISAVTFPTIFNIILQCGLVPVVVDVDIKTFTFRMDAVEKAITDKTKAIIAIHPLGIPADMEALKDLVRDKNIYVIEDNCDGWGGTLHGKKLGSFGDLSITSFHGAHIVSTAGTGGGVFTDDDELAKKVRMYRDWGRQADTKEPNKYPSLPDDYNPRFIYEKIGYNFQILELQAAMGRVQLKKSEEIKRKRRENVEYLTSGLHNHPLELSRPIKGSDPCWFAFPITYFGDRGDLVKYLESKGIETRSMFSGDITKHPAYENSVYRVSGELLGAQAVLKHSFWITSHPRLTMEDREYILEAFYEYFNKNKST